MVAARELSAVDSTLFTLDDVATAIWKAVDGVTPLHDVIEQRLRAQYDVALDVAVADVECFVEELARRGILLISDEPILFPVRKS
jgi:hypothetical protein